MKDESSELSARSAHDDPKQGGLLTEEEQKEHTDQADNGQEVAEPPEQTEVPTVEEPPKEEDTSAHEGEFLAENQPPKPRKRRRLRGRKAKVLRIEQDHGTLEMRDTIIPIIVRKEATIDGVAAIRGRGLRRKMRKFLARGRVVDGIYVEQEDGHLNLEVTLAINYGENIPDVAAALRERLTEKIEYMTGCTVNYIDIIVDRIVMDNESQQ